MILNDFLNEENHLKIDCILCGINVSSLFYVQIAPKESYADVKIRFPTANDVSPAAVPSPNSPVVSLGDGNVTQDNVMSNHLNVHKWYV